MKRTWLAALLAAALAPAGAGAQTIRGVVVEDSTRVPVDGVTVELLAPDSAAVDSARTDSTGTFVLSPGRPGSYALRVTPLPYEAAPIPLEVGPAETLQLELRVGRTTVPLEPLVVEVHRDRQLAEFYDRMNNHRGFGHFLSREQIEARGPGARVTDLLRMMPGVQIVAMSPQFPGAGNLITMRGGVGRCLPDVYIDGMPVEQYGGSGVDDLLSSAMLEGVEVYPSTAGVPGVIHARGSCGVVAFWTKRDTGGRWSWKKLLVGVGLGALLLLLAR
jgi:hypothetical protein